MLEPRKSATAPDSVRRLALSPASRTRMPAYAARNSTGPVRPLGADAAEEPAQLPSAGHLPPRGLTAQMLGRSPMPLRSMVRSSQRAAAAWLRLRRGVWAAIARVGLQSAWLGPLWDQRRFFSNIATMPRSPPAGPLSEGAEDRIAADCPEIREPCCRADPGVFTTRPSPASDRPEQQSFPSSIRHADLRPWMPYRGLSPHRST